MRRSECSNVYFDLGNEFLVSILEVNFLAHICFKCVRKIVQVQLLKLTLIYCQKSRIFSQKARARALLFRFLRNQKIHEIYIILSLHAKNQLPMTILSYFKHCLNFSESNTFHAPPPLWSTQTRYKYDQPKQDKICSTQTRYKFDQYKN